LLRTHPVFFIPAPIVLAAITQRLLDLAPLFGLATAELSVLPAAFRLVVAAFSGPGYVGA
jgi:hypothetical protein